MNFSTQWFKNSWWKSLGLKGQGLKLGVENSGVKMSFNRIKSWNTILQNITATNEIEQILPQSLSTFTAQ